MIEYSQATESDIDEIEVLYRKHLDNGAALRKRLDFVCRDPSTLSCKAVDSETGKLAGLVMYTPGISFSCCYPELVKEVEDYTNDGVVYTGESIFVDDSYRGQNIAHTIEEYSRGRMEDIQKTLGKPLYALHELWVYPNGKIPALRIVRDVFKIDHDLGIIQGFYRDYFKNGFLCPVCGENCQCSAQIVLSRIGGK